MKKSTGPIGTSLARAPGYRGKELLTQAGHRLRQARSTGGRHEMVTRNVSSIRRGLKALCC
jgi:hypothetical protein